jgi:sugar lactone lactonase YvrE
VLLATSGLALVGPAEAQTSQVGVLQVVAGTGQMGFSGDGGPALAATFRFPTGIARSSDGTIYVADFQNDRVRKIDPAGIITTIAGDGVRRFAGDGALGTYASLNLPTGVAVDGLGRILIADFFNNRIRRVDLGGNISTFAGNGIGSFSGDGGQATLASLQRPGSVQTGSNGDVIIGDDGNRRIRKVKSSGEITTVLSNDGLPVGFEGTLTRDDLGNLFFTSPLSNQVKKLDPSGNVTLVAGNGSTTFSGDGGPATNAGLNPGWMTTDIAGNLFVSDYSNNRIRKIAVNGLISTVARLNGPRGLVTDPQGNLFIASEGHKIHKVFLGVPVPRDALDIDVSRLANEASGARSYSVALKLRTASSGTVGFSVSPGHQPFQVSAGSTTFKPVVSGVATWEYQLTNPRGVFRVTAFVDQNNNQIKDASELLLSAEVK